MQTRRLFGLHEDQQQDVQYGLDIALICGPSRSGKTSMLFQYAYSYAQEGRNVVFICSKKKIQNALPLPTPASTFSQTVLDKIHMKYIEDDKTLRNYMASIHLFPETPELIVIDDLSSFFGAAVQAVSLAKTLAFLKEAGKYCTSNLTPSKSCMMLISDGLSGDNVPRQQNILQKWIPLILVITAGNQGAFTLSVRVYNYQADPYQMKASYFVQPHQSFYLSSLEYSPQSNIVPHQ